MTEARLHPSRTWPEQRVAHAILCRATPPIPHRRPPDTKDRSAAPEERP